VESFVFFRLFGPVQAWVGDREVPLGGARARAVLALRVPKNSSAPLTWPFISQPDQLARVV
jgi:hypothetical protein